MKIYYIIVFYEVTENLKEDEYVFYLPESALVTRHYHPKLYVTAAARVPIQCTWCMRGMFTVLYVLGGICYFRVCLHCLEYETMQHAVVVVGMKLIIAQICKFSKRYSLAMKTFCLTILI